MPSRQDLSPFTIFTVTCVRVGGRVFPELPKFPVKKKKFQSQHNTTMLSGGLTLLG